jgi:hypothetical protein
MGFFMCKTVTCALLAGLLSVPMIGNAVMFHSTGDAAYNTTAPTGTLTNSGWQFQGKFLQYLGTPIAPHHFITAKHLGSWTNYPFIFEGESYEVINAIPDSDSDLMLYEVNGTFPFYAPLYTSGNEVGKPLVVFGRGVHRGDPVYLNGDLRGWKWELYDSEQDDLLMRWGENVVTAADIANPGEANESPVLTFAFDETGGINECALADKDSGGAVFIQDPADDTWKLAGINFTLNPFYYSFDGFATYFYAALYDYSYKNNNDPEKLYYTDWGFTQLPIKSRFSAVPGASCSTRISSRYSWITNNIPDFDRDVDGLPDWWETLYAGNPTAMEREGHLDGDGFTNYEEWLADTVPTDSNSFLRVTAYTNSTSLVFSSSDKRKYQIQYHTDLAETNVSWQTEVDWFEGDPLQTAQSVSNFSSNRFYRVRAKLR